MPRDIRPFTQEQWWDMCDAGMGMPVPATRDAARECDSFVYDRRWGLFPVGVGMHYYAMATLLAFHHSMGRREYQRVDDYRSGLQDMAEVYLDTIPGTAFRSSVSTRLTCGRREHLTRTEAGILFADYEIRYIRD